jgi:predicted ATP-grasp superfamily ATP-dependent carboligase
MFATMPSLDRCLVALMILIVSLPDRPDTPGAEHPLNIMKKQMTTRINIMPGGGV